MQTGFGNLMELVERFDRTRKGVKRLLCVCYGFTQYAMDWTCIVLVVIVLCVLAGSHLSCKLHNKACDAPCVSYIISNWCLTLDVVGDTQTPSTDKK